MRGAAAGRWTITVVVKAVCFSPVQVERGGPGQSRLWRKAHGSFEGGSVLQHG